MAQTPTLFYHVMVERFRGSAPKELDETLDCEVFCFADLEDACEKARAAVAGAPAPVLLPEGVEMTQAEVESFYYVGEDDEPLSRKSLAEYRALEDTGQAFLEWGRDWQPQHFQQDLPPEIVDVLAERERVAYEEWAAAERSAVG